MPSPEAVLHKLFPVLLMAVSVSSADPDCSEAERKAYLEAVRQDILASWRLPYEYEAISCTILIKQDFRGEVEHVGIGRCGEDRELVLSVVNAGYRASPMPLPDNRACFTRDLIVTLTFTPVAG